MCWLRHCSRMPCFIHEEAPDGSGDPQNQVFPSRWASQRLHNDKSPMENWRFSLSLPPHYTVGSFKPRPIKHPAFLLRRVISAPSDRQQNASGHLLAAPLGGSMTKLQSCQALLLTPRQREEEGLTRDSVHCQQVWALRLLASGTQISKNGFITKQINKYRRDMKHVAQRGHPKDQTSPCRPLWDHHGVGMQKEGSKM